MMFLAAGYETTSAAIAKITHDLAVHPQLQKRVQQEIDEHFPGEVREKRWSCHFKNLDRQTYHSSESMFHYIIDTKS